MILLASFSTFAICAQSTKFTSAYTSLGQGCKVLAGGNGTDEGSLCRGLGGYRIRIYGSAAALHINAEIKEESFNIAMLSIGFNERNTRLEWRLANGKPFAVIMRVPKYGEATTDDPYFGKVIGEQLIVKGLKSFEDINFSVDAKKAGANATARELADNAYAAAKK